MNSSQISKPNVALPCKVKGPSKGCIKLYPSFSASKTSLNAVFGLVYLILALYLLHVFIRYLFAVSYKKILFFKLKIFET